MVLQTSSVLIIFCAALPVMLNLMAS